jgi:rare lipoprotein A
LRRALVFLLALGLVASCSPFRKKPKEAGVGYQEKGVASWYGPGFHGKRTANGEVYDMDAMTAAHKTLPFDLIVEVKNLDNGQKTRVRINDRGPFVKGRIIDLSRAGAKAIDMLGPGTAKVVIRVVDGPHPIEKASSYWVQVGAFRDRANAGELERDLERSFKGANIREGDGWFRVGFGPFKKRKEADEMARQLDKAGFGAMVIAGN